MTGRKSSVPLPGLALPPTAPRLYVPARSPPDPAGSSRHRLPRMPRTDHLRRRCPAALIALVIACGSGCTSVLSTASLRDLVWAAGEPHAAEAATATSDGSKDGSGDDASPAPDSADSPALDEERREAAIDEAVDRLAKLGAIGEAARATLVETLERTSPEDWPAVVEAFAESLPPEAHTAAKADLDAAHVPATEPAPASAPVATAPSPPAADEAPIVTVAVPVSPEPAPEGPFEPAAPPIAPAPADAALTVENACFATRVQAWGVVERFSADRFRPGQEVIVYFELAGLSASESSAGHTTCIDSTLRLVAADGSVIHAWSFEPIAETCRAQRHDYFARYVVRLPETAAAGACRIELGVTDTLSGKTASATLPLELLTPLAAH